MKLQQLLEGIACQTALPMDTEVLSLTGDSRQVEPGAMFVCRKGLKFDGHDHAAQALADGAAVLVVQRDLGLPGQVLVEDTHLAFSLLCANWFGNPSRKLKMVGITGTNGKTTTTFLIRSILAHAGEKAGLIGTVQNEIGSMVLPARHTTPDPMQLHALLDRMVRAGCQYAVMEVSSHALDQKRVAGCHFAVSAFTNLTQDHLDYHHSMEEYFAAKKKLFDCSDEAVINYDDAHGRLLLESCPCPAVSFSLQSDRADYTARDIRSTVEGSVFELVGEGQIGRVRIHTPGDFSVANAMTAALCCLRLGLTLQQVIDGLAACSGVPGRFEVIPTNAPFTVIRDYAHGPDGLEKLLSAVTDIKAGRRVVTLFGCAGMRDRTKRASMGKIAASYSDRVILTSDNPREEPEQQILDDCLPGILETGKPYLVIADRLTAIRRMLEEAQPGDILLLLGKGHEDYQALGYATVCFNEREIVQQLCAGKYPGGQEGADKK